VRTDRSRAVVLTLGWLVLFGTVAWLATFPVTVQL
jgi:hypothetical protein